jgi:hypothetical protein
LNTDDAQFEAARILDKLSVSASELGYRVQALFAETLVRMGAGIDTVARVGHPDVMARIRDRLLRVQVKVTRQRSFRLDADDLEGIRPMSSREDGYLAVLSLGPPMRWICVRHTCAEYLVGRTVPLAMLSSMKDAEFSSQCTDNCVEILMERRDSIEAFTFALARKRVLVEGRLD